ncbi:MAG: MFS transporter [Nanoarchaeota archaeon]
MKTSKDLYKSNIWKFYAYKFVHNFHFFAGILVPFFTIFGGINFVQIMILQAIFTISIFLLEIPTGVLADKFGRKISLALAGFIGMIGFLIYASYPNFWAFAMGEFTLATSASLISGADQSLFYDSLREIRKEKTSKKLFGRLNSIGLFGLMIAAPIGSLLALHFGFRTVMLLMSIPMLLTAFIALTFKEPEIGRKLSKGRSYTKILSRGITYFKNHKTLRIMAFDYVSISVFAFFLIWVYQLKLQSLGVEIGIFGFVHSALVLVQIIVLNTFISFEKLVNGKRRYLLFSAILTGFGFILIALASTFFVAFFGIMIVGAFGLTRRLIFQNYINKHVNSSERATVLSTVSMLYMFSMTIMNVVLGYFVEINMTYTLFALGLIIIALGIFSKLEEEHLID